MKTRLSIGLLLAVISGQASAQLPVNFSYGRYLTAVEDQLRQGPCESFAAAGGVEAFYNLLHSGSGTERVNLSEREVYVCGGAPTKGVDTALNYIRDQGVIPRACYAMPVTQCLEHLGDQGPTQVVYETGRNCPAAQKSCGSRYRANHLRLTTQVTSNDGIKRALLEHGPLVIGIDDGGAIHTAYHGYVLYGWETQGATIYWLLRDSWPCSPKNIRSNINLAAIFSDTTKPRYAYAITSVWKEVWNGTAWQPQTRAVQAFELEQGMQTARIAPPANSCLNQGQYSVIGTLPPGSSIVGWSVRASYNYLNDAQISSTGVLSGNAADAIVTATLQRANGMKENITLPVATVGVPHMVDAQSYCPTTTQREIDLRLMTRTLSGYSYTQAINIPPSSDGSYYAIGSGSWFVHLVSRKAQAITYGTTVTATQSGNPGCSRTVTIPNRHVVAMPCSYGW